VRTIVRHPPSRAQVCDLAGSELRFNEIAEKGVADRRFRNERLPSKLCQRALTPDAAASRRGAPVAPLSATRRFRGAAVLTAPLHQLRPPHVIVVGNEKGGSGKSTIAIHIIVALMKAGQRVATIDLDSRQKTLTHYIESRRGWARRSRADLELPTHFCIARAESARMGENEAVEFADFERAIAVVQDRHDFVVIDTPPHDSYLMRLAHSITDTLVTPLNDSFLDLDVLATLDPVNLAVTGVSHYGELVCETRRHRRSLDGALLDWVVVRNRVSLLGSYMKAVLCADLDELALRLGFRVAPGFTERQIYRNLFLRGLTALDEPSETMPGIGSGAVPARREIQALFEALKLPIDDRGRRHAALRAEWFASHDSALDTDDILADPGNESVTTK
jgi:chromosome partitioning protein